MDSQHHRPDEFTRKKVPDNELQIYTWYGHGCHAAFSDVQTRQTGLADSCCVHACTKYLWCICVRVRSWLVLSVDAFRHSNPHTSSFTCCGVSYVAAR